MQIKMGAAVLQTDSVSQMLWYLSAGGAASTDKSHQDCRNQTTAKTSGTKSKAKCCYCSFKSAVTVMVYMNGSNLENIMRIFGRFKGNASATLSGNVNVCQFRQAEQKNGIHPAYLLQSQRFIIKNKALKLVDDSLGQLGHYFRIYDRGFHQLLQNRLSCRKIHACVLGSWRRRGLWFCSDEM